ncbi:MAG: AIR synthase family protein, partial [Dehalococcoidia bacterium]
GSGLPASWGIHCDMMCLQTPQSVSPCAMDVGKLPPQLLQRLLQKARTEDSRVLLGPGIGEDAAVLEMEGDRVLVAKTDPITFATDNIGWYSVHINANDIAATGAVPRWYLATLLVPEGTDAAAIAEIFDQIIDACRSLDISLVGGHTEITYDLERPIVVGAMLGEANKGDITATSDARPADRIILTKGIAIEGTSVLARESAELLESQGMAKDSIERARNYLYDPGISVVAEASKARSVATVHCMHDPTEGGLITGLREIAAAAKVGVRLYRESIPVLPECRDVCDRLGLDPLGLLASGALLITIPASEAPGLLRALDMEGIEAYDIGEVTEESGGLKMVTGEGEEEMPSFVRDELARFFSSSTPRH